MAVKMMKAAVLTGPERVEIKEIAPPMMEPGKLEIDVNACGVCGSDIQHTDRLAVCQ